MDMPGEVSVTYKDGAFHPDRPLHLPEGVKGTVWVAPDAPTEESRAKAWELIERIRRERLVRSGGRKFNREELYDRG